MVFKPGQSGNPLGYRPYARALQMEAALHEHGGRAPHVRKGSLRYIARQALLRAGHNTAALEHVAARLDGPVISGPEDPVSQQIVEIRVVMVEAQPKTIEHDPQLQLPQPEKPQINEG